MIAFTPTRHAQDLGLQARFVALYGELQQIARRQMAGNGAITITPTALVHEAWLKFDGKNSTDGSRESFLAMAARAMRQVLIDHIRARNAVKRGGDQDRVDIVTQLPGDSTPAVDLLEIEQALQELETLDARLAEMVIYRFYGGMDFAEIARHQGISERTCHRDWRRARAFIQARLGS